MINIPLPTIKEKILENSEISEQELNKKINAKLEQLSGLISEEGAAHIIANEMGVKLVQTSGKLEIKNILEGMRNVEVEGKVARKYEVRTFHSGERSGKVGSFMLADPTGIIRAVLWNDQADNMEKFSEGDVLLLKSAYCRGNNGRKELHMNDNSEIKVNPPGVSVDVDIKETGTDAERKKLVDLEQNDSRVEVLATIVQAFEPRFFEVCPGCGKRARPVNDGEGYECRTHGVVKDPDYAYVMNIFLDDGSDNVRTVLWREQVVQLLDMEDSDVGKFRENPADFEPLKNELLGNIVKVVGRVQRNEGYDRLELVAYSIERNPDPGQEIENIKAEKSSDLGIAGGKSEEKPKPAKTSTESKAKKKEEAKATASLKAETKNPGHRKDEAVDEDEDLSFDDLDFDDDDIVSVEDL